MLRKKKRDGRGLNPGPLNPVLNARPQTPPPATYCWRVTPRWTRIPSRGGGGNSTTPRYASCKGNRDKFCLGIWLGSAFTLTLPPAFIGAVTLVVFPKAPHGEIAWVGFVRHFDHRHVCGHTATNCPRGRKNLGPVSWETPL